MKEQRVSLETAVDLAKEGWKKRTAAHVEELMLPNQIELSDALLEFDGAQFQVGDNSFKTLITSNINLAQPVDVLAREWIRYNKMYKEYEDMQERYKKVMPLTQFIPYKEKPTAESD